MSAVNRLDIDQSWVRLQGMLGKFDQVSGDEEWVLVPGGTDTANVRFPWTVRGSITDRTILILGYTQRDVLSALANQCAILAAILGA